MEYTFEQLKKKINRAEKKLKQDKELLQTICSHKNLIFERGYNDYQGYDRDYIKGHAYCEDCKLWVNEDNKEKYEQLEKIYYKNHYERFY